MSQWPSGSIAKRLNGAQRKSELWPDRANPPSVGSFPSPVTPPNVDPDASPTKSIAINCQWLPYVRGALQQLLLQATWAGDAGAIALAQQRAFNLIDLFQECSSADYAFECVHDFAFNSYSGIWSIQNDCSTPAGNYTPGIGYEGTDMTCGANHQREVGIKRNLVAVVNHIHVILDWNPASSFPSSDIAFQIYGTGLTSHNLTGAMMPGTGTIDLNFFPANESISDLGFWALADYEPGGTPLGGSVTIREVEVFGTTHNPSGPPCL